MIFTWREVWGFFTVMTAVAWLLYPSDYFRGQMHRLEGDRATSITFLRRYLERRPFHKGATLALAAAYEAAGRPEEAQGPLLAFYRHRRGDVETGLATLGLLERLGRQAAADEFRWELIADLRRLPLPDRRRIEELLYGVYQRAAVRRDDASMRRALEELTEAGSGAGYGDELLRVLLARGDFEGALSKLRKAAAKNPGDPEIPRLIARVQRARGNSAAATSALTEGLSGKPDHPGLLGDRASILLSLRRWDEAAIDLRRLARLEPHEDAWPRELARALISAGRITEGVAVHESRIRRDPDRKESWWSLVYAFSDLKRHEEAASVLERYLARFPADLEALDAVVYHHQMAGRPELAIDRLRRRVSQAPGDLRRAKAYASLLAEEERDAEAVAACEGILAVHPEDKDTWRALAYLHERADEHAAAAHAWERYLRRFPGDGQATEKLARAYVAMGNRKKAIAVLQAYFTKGPDKPPAKAARPGRP